MSSNCNITVGVYYSFTFEAVNGTSPFTWTKISGSFPPGLSLNEDTGELSGTPTEALGIYTFTIKVTDSLNNTSTIICSLSPAGTAESCGIFELYKVLPPTVVQVLPIARRYDQIHLELFRYGKLRKLFIRLISFGGTVIPYEIFAQDTSLMSGSLTVVDSIEDTYEIGLPKTIAASILRIVLGPVAFSFHRWYCVLQVMRSGRDTENEFITLEYEK